MNSKMECAHMRRINQFTGAVVFPALVSLLLTVISPVSSQSLKVHFGPLEEETEISTRVGNIAKSTPISTEVSNYEFSYLQFSFLDTSNPHTRLFQLENSGQLLTKSVIDRESICKDMEECEINFDVAVNSEVTDYLRLVAVSVTITDKNDNMPTFKKKEIILNIMENNRIGLEKPLPVAEDKDVGENGVQIYELLNPHGPFSLDVEKRINNRFRLTLVVHEALDREVQDWYTLTVVASDGGLQPMTGTLTVHVNVTDQNDNKPFFTKSEYDFSVEETSQPGEVVDKITAIDLDAGRNSDIKYSMEFMTRDSRGADLFDIDHYTGEITIKSTLQADAGKVFHAVVEARDGGEVPEVGDANLKLTIVNVVNNAPTLKVILQHLKDNSVQISEATNKHLLVGTLTASDNDPGTSGDVHCESRHKKFKVQHTGEYYAIILNDTLDREEEASFYVTLSCRDDGNPPKYASAKFHVEVGDVNDNAPEFEESTYFVEVLEDVPVNTKIFTLTAVDPDNPDGSSRDGHRLTYSLHPENNDNFSIDRYDGTFRTRDVFDRELADTFAVLVTVQDEGGKSSTCTVNVKILDVNDNAPVIINDVIKVSEGGGSMRTIGHVTGSDVDIGKNGQLIFSMPPTGDSIDQLIKVNSNGSIVALQELDRESWDRAVLKLVVRDNGDQPKSSSGSVTIIVTDINDSKPKFHFPALKNHTVIIKWDMDLYKEIVRVNVSDADLGQNSKLSYAIVAGNKEPELFGLDQQAGILYLKREVKESDDITHVLTIEARDNGVPYLSSQQDIDVVIDTVNATFAAAEGKTEETYILIAGIIGGATLLFSIIILVVFFLVCRDSNRRQWPPAPKPPEWQVVKTGVQEECGKEEVEKVVAWRGSNVDIEDKDPSGGRMGGGFSPGSQPDVTKTGKDNTLKKGFSSNSSTWGDTREGNTSLGIGLDPYRKQDFYTFCKVRNSHDDVHSVTSGETTTSDSGRGGSEDDIPLPPIAECSPELNSSHNSPKHMTEYRPVTTSPSSSLTRPQVKSDYRTMPSLSTFKSADPKFQGAPHPLQGDSHTYPYNSDKVHPSSRANHGYTSLTQIPANKSSGPGRHVTFSSNQNRGTNSLPRDDPLYESHSRRSPYSSGYDHMVPEVGGLYTIRPHSIEDDDGNTTTSGSYTIDSDNLNDSIISA